MPQPQSQTQAPRGAADPRAGPGPGARHAGDAVAHGDRRRARRPRRASRCGPPAPGALAALITREGRQAGRGSARAARPGAVTIGIKLDAATRRKLRRVRRLAVRVELTFRSATSGPALRASVRTVLRSGR